MAQIITVLKLHIDPYSFTLSLLCLTSTSSLSSPKLTKMVTTRMKRFNGVGTDGTLHRKTGKSGMWDEAGTGELELTTVPVTMLATITPTETWRNNRGRWLGCRRCWPVDSDNTWRPRRPSYSDNLYDKCGDLDDDPLQLLLRFIHGKCGHKTSIGIYKGGGYTLVRSHSRVGFSQSKKVVISGY